MRIPEKLKAGDTIGIVATARKMNITELAASFSILESWGLKVKTGITIGAEHFQFAGTDEVRKNDFQQMLDDSEVHAILFARGGYGTSRIIDEIDWRKFARHPKWLCGFSDITVVHSHLSSLYGISTLHSPMALTLAGETEESQNLMKQILFGEKPACRFAAHEQNRLGTMRGEITGGNLSMLYSLAGTPSDIQCEGKILFIEDVDEHYYHVDRMLGQLQRSGKLSALAGLLVGNFSDLKNKDAENPFGANEKQMILERVAEYDYPVAFEFPAGHEKKNISLVMGAAYQAEITEGGCLLSFQ
jgi:muramoyltetrapeptide carboxypeptidase